MQRLRPVLYNFSRSTVQLGIMTGSASCSDTNCRPRSKVGSMARSIIINTDMLADDALIIAQYVAMNEVFIRYSYR